MKSALSSKSLFKIVFSKPVFLKLLVLCTIYKALLEYVYKALLSKRWGYAGFIYTKPQIMPYLGSWCLLILIVVVLSMLDKMDTFSSIILECIIVLSYIPGIVLFTCKEQEMLGLFLLYWLFLFICYFVIIPEKDVAYKIDISESFLQLLSYVFFFFCFAIWAIYARFNVLSSIIYVYDQREIAANYNMPKIMKYLYGSIQVCIPFLAVWALNRKKTATLIILIAAQILSFFSQGSKSALFALIVGIATHYVTDIDKKRQSGIIITLGGVLLCVVSLLGNLFHSTFVPDYILRRNMFLPNLLNIYYYDYFNTHEYDYFRSSFLRFFGFSSPYSENSIPREIGAVYFNAPRMYANNGLFSDAYSNLGVLGIVVMPILVVLLLRFFDKCIGKTSLDMMVGAAVYVVFCMIGSTFFTNLFSHGFIMLALLFCFLQKNNTQIKK